MAWTEPITWTNVLSDASDFNEQIRDNLLALKQPPTSHYEANELSNYSTFSTTYANLDSDWSFSFSSNGGDLLIGLAACATGLDFGLLDVLIDSTRIANNTSGGIRKIVSSNTTNVSFLRWVRGLPAGTYTITLQWKNNSGGANSNTMRAGAGTVNEDVHPRFWVREVS